MNKQEIAEAVDDLQRRRLELEEAKGEDRFDSAEGAMETAAITIKLAQLWELWQNIPPRG